MNPGNNFKISPDYILFNFLKLNIYAIIRNFQISPRKKNMSFKYFFKKLSLCTQFVSYKNLFHRENIGVFASSYAQQGST